MSKFDYFPSHQFFKKKYGKLSIKDMIAMANAELKVKYGHEYNIGINNNNMITLCKSPQTTYIKWAAGCGECMHIIGRYRDNGVEMKIGDSYEPADGSTIQHDLQILLGSKHVLELLC